MAKKIYNLWVSYNNSSQQNINEGNRIINDVVKLMLGGGTFLFVLSGTIFGPRISELCNCLKILLIVSWALIIFSFVFGIKQLITDSNFFGHWSDLYKRAMDKLVKYEDDEKKAVEESNKIFENEKLVSSMWAFWFQLSLLGISFIIQVIVVSILLFAKVQ